MAEFERIPSHVPWNAFVDLSCFIERFSAESKEFMLLLSPGSYSSVTAKRTFFAKAKQLRTPRQVSVVCWRGEGAGLVGGTACGARVDRAVAWVSSRASVTAVCSGQRGFGSSLSLLVMDRIV